MFWRTHRRAAKRLELLEREEGKRLADIIRRQRKVIPARLLQVLAQRARYDLRLFWNTTLNPLRRSTYALKSALGTAFAGARVSLNYQPAITPEVLRDLRQKLRPGDILLVRADEKLTAALLPGFWSHAAIYLGNRQELERCGLHDDFVMSRFQEAVTEPERAFVIEAVAPRLGINPLEKSLFGDHVLALRPNLPLELIRAALREAFAHLGKPYDFEFNFNITHRIVCTELVYRAFHKKGEIEFTLVKRLGRFTLTGNDIVHYALDSLKKSPSPLSPLALVLKRAKRGVFVPEESIVPALEQIRSGKIPDQLDLRSSSLVERT